MHSAEAFRYFLQRERLRTARTGGKFSVIGFLPRDEDDTPLWHFLAKILRRRLRVTDDICWLDDQRLGVLLPLTHGLGAWALADAVCKQFPDDIMPPLCTVYTYTCADTDGAAPITPTEDLSSPKPVSTLDMLYGTHAGLKRLLGINPSIISSYRQPALVAGNYHRTFAFTGLQKHQNWARFITSTNAVCRRGTP